MRKPTIVLVEDNLSQIKIFNQLLEQHCAKQHLGIPVVETYSSEGSFLESLERQSSPADLYIFDLMLRWKEVDEELTLSKPSDYHADSAGIRCKNAVLSRFPNAKVIIWTLIEAGHIPLTEFDGARLCPDKFSLPFLELDNLFHS